MSQATASETQDPSAASAAALPPDALSPRALERLARRVHELLCDDLVRQRERRGAGPGRWR